MQKAEAVKLQNYTGSQKQGWKVEQGRAGTSRVPPNSVYTFEANFLSFMES